MKAKILLFTYDDKSATKLIRAFGDQHYEQAENDLSMLQEFGSSDKNYRLEEVEIYQPNTTGILKTR